MFGSMEFKRRVFVSNAILNPPFQVRFGTQINSTFPSDRFTQTPERFNEEDSVRIAVRRERAVETPYSCVLSEV